MLIGLAGKARSGKDTSGLHIQTLLQGHSLYSYAGPLKNAMNDWLGWDARHGWGECKEMLVPVKADFRTLPVYLFKHFEKSMTIDECVKVTGIMQRLISTEEALYQNKGGDYFYVISPRQVYQWFGTEGMREGVKDSFWVDLAPKKNAIICDVRFNNEAESIREAGGHIIHIVREDADKIVSHSSEGGVDVEDQDVIVVNSRDIQFLQEALNNTVAELYKPYRG